MTRFIRCWNGCRVEGADDLNVNGYCERCSDEHALLDGLLAATGHDLEPSVQRAGGGFNRHGPLVGPTRGED